MTSSEVVVVGAGIAGVTAALAASRQGRDVTVLAKSVGATGVASGAFDFGPVPSRTTLAAVESLSFEKLRSTTWSPVYRSVLADVPDLVSRSDAERWLGLLGELVGKHLPLVFDLNHPMLLPSTRGIWKPTFGAQRMQAAADLGRWVGKRVRLVTAPGWRFLAAELAAHLAQSARDREVEIDLAVVTLPNLDRWADSPLSQVATRLRADGALRERFTQAVADLPDADLLLLPPLFLDPAHWEELERRVGGPIAECLATVEPVAGQRLQAALWAALRDQGIDLVRADAVRPVFADARIEAMEWRPRGSIQWERGGAGRVIAATGRYFGGGMRLNYESIEESVFDLPVFRDRDLGRVGARAQLDWSDRDFSDAQEWARIGSWVDSSWRPVDVDGRPVRENLHACGSIVGGIDWPRFNVGMGFMAYSGGQCGFVAAQA